MLVWLIGIVKTSTICRTTMKIIDSTKLDERHIVVWLLSYFDEVCSIALLISDFLVDENLLL